MPKIIFKWLGIAVIFSLFFAIYHHYPTLLFYVVEWQKRFNQQISGALIQLQQHSQQAGFTLLFISFAYGIIHAVGPGHGKFVLAGYLSLEKTRLPQAIKITLCSSLVQGGVAIALVSVLVVLFTLSRHYFNFTVQWVERGSFLLIMLLGMWWIIKAVLTWKKAKKSPTIQRLMPLKAGSPLLTPPIQQRHHTNCGCGHQHFPTAHQLQRAHDWKSEWLTILSMGIRPCSGAILVLFLAYTLDLYPWGVASALAMALGTGITLSFFAILILFARHKALQLSKWYLARQQHTQLAQFFTLAIGIVMLLMGLLLLHSSFITSVVSPLRR